MCFYLCLILKASHSTRDKGSYVPLMLTDE